MSALGQVFSDKKLVDSPALNRLGAQPLRAVGARTRYRLRRSPQDPVFDDIATNGFAMIEDFLPDDVFAATVEEADDYVDSFLPTWLHTLGTTTLRQFVLGRIDVERFPKLAAWQSNPQVLDLAAGAERRPVSPWSGGALIEDITLGDYSLDDEQTRLHIDAVFNTHKVWLYLCDVTPENAPLVYVPQSHRLDTMRLREEYRDSNDATRCVDPSRRVSDTEVRRRGLAPQVITCPRNTLVIVNTCGYHARSVGEPGNHRRALHMSFRFDPFRYRSSRTRHGLGKVRRALTRASR